MTHYEERDAQGLDEAGGYYTRRVCAMTREGLDAKSDIAAELAWRDKRIDELSKVLDDMKLPCNVLLSPGLWLRKGVSVRTLHQALFQRDEFERLRESMPDDDREEVRKHIERFKDLLK